MIIAVGTKIMCSIELGAQSWAGGEVGWVLEVNDTDYRVKLHPCGMTGWVEHRFVSEYNFVENQSDVCQG